ncbi:TPA: hypothetical protein ACJHFC_000316 [Clostridioides difficile]
MRFNVHGFDQKMAIEFGLSNDELLILRHFEDFVCSGKMDSFYENGYMFYWVNYEKFLNDLPILNITKERLGEIMVHSLGERPKGLDAKLSSYSEKMLKKVKNRKYIGVLRSKAIKNPTIGVRSYFSFTNKFYELKRHITSNDNEINTDSVLIPDRVGINTNTDSVLIPIQTRYQYRNKDYSINDYSINDNISPNKRDDIAIAPDDRGVCQEMIYPIAPNDRGVCHQVIGNNTNINNTNISNNTQSKKSLKNDRTDSDAHGNNESNLYYIASLNGGLCENLGSERPQGGFCENLGVGSVRAPKKTYNKKTYIKSNTTPQNEPKTDYLDLSFLDLDIEKVKLTKDEYDKLISKFGKKYIHDKIVSLENYIVNGKGSRYKSHYRALLTWGNGDASKGIVPEVTKTKNFLSGFKEL